MNCLDYRRVLLAGEGESPAMQEHRLQCRACAELRREHEGFEAGLRSALEVPLPAGLEARMARAAGSGRRRFLAAAGVAALAAGGGAAFWLARRDGPLALACIEFVMKEEAKSIMMGALPRAEARAALAATLPLERIERIGQVRHVGPCPFNGQTAYHVVLAVPQGKVTLLVMPETKLASRESAVREGLYAAVISLRRGSVGVVAGSADVMKSVSNAVRG